MKSKKYYIDLINHTKIIKESETLNSNGNTHIFLELSPAEYSSNKMTINDLAKQLSELVNTVNGLTKTMNDRFDKIEKRLDEHDAIFVRNNLK